MQTSLRQLLVASGAVIGNAAAGAQHFGNAEAELDCAFTACALVDQSDLMRLLALGPDTLSLLHRLSTADLQGLPPGSGKPTVLTSAKGRIVERLFVHHLAPQRVMLVDGRGSAARVIEHLRRYTFQEQLEVSDLMDQTCQLALIGPRAAEALEQLGWPRPLPFHAVEAVHGTTNFHVLGQDGLTGEGFSVVGPAEMAAELWAAISERVSAVGGRPAGRWAIESYRVLRGLPASGHELTEEHNPLEAGLWDAVSFSKGCYVGQEVVARLRTYDKVARALVGLELPAGSSLPEPLAPLFSEGREVGSLTSVILPPGRQVAVGLGYVKRKEITEGRELQVGAPGGPTARIVKATNATDA